MLGASDERTDPEAESKVEAVVSKRAYLKETGSLVGVFSLLTLPEVARYQTRKVLFRLVLGKSFVYLIFSYLPAKMIVHFMHVMCMERLL